jgi:hypothetical protein
VDGRVVSSDVVRGEPVGCAAHTAQHNLPVHRAVLGAIRTDLLYEVGTKEQQVKYEKELSVKIIYFICVVNVMKVMLSNKCYDSIEYTAVPTFLQLECLKTYCGYVKPHIIPNTIYIKRDICVININMLKFN